MRMSLYALRDHLDNTAVTVVTCKCGYYELSRGEAVSLDVTERIRAARALRSRPFILLWGGQTISALGDGAYTPALALQTLALTHSSAALAAIIAATIVPRLIFLLVGGLVADRLPRRAVLFASDAGRALVVGTIAVLSWSGAATLALDRARRDLWRSWRVLPARLSRDAAAARDA